VLKNHGKGDIKFQDKLCQQVQLCQKWVDPEELKKQKMEEEMPQVFF
jgi:hypothetical protein